jgi:hypothetical protein
MILKNCLGFYFLSEMAACILYILDRHIDIYIHIHTYVCCRFNIYVYIPKLELTENGNFRLFAANTEQKSKLRFVFCKWKMEVCFL